MSSKTYFSRELGQKIIYKSPLFIIDLDLKEEVKGGKDESTILDYYSITHNEDLRLRFMYALHYAIKNSSSILRQIFLRKNIDFNVLQKYAKNISNEDHLDNMAYDILLEDQKCRIELFPFQDANKEDLNIKAKDLYNKTNPKECIIVKTHDITLADDAAALLSAWYRFLQKLTNNSQQKRNIYHIDKIISTLESAGFKFDGTYTPRSDPDNNPLYVSYLLMIR